MSKGVEAALTDDVSVVMTTQKSRYALYEQYGKDIVDQSLTTWSALNKVVERESSPSNMVRRAKSPSDAWTLLKSMIESDDSASARDNSKEGV